MTKVTIYSNQEVERRYPKGSSYVANIAHYALENEFRIASIKSNSFFGSWERIIKLCATTIKSENNFYIMKFVIDVKLDQNEVIFAFDDKNNQ